MTDPMDQWFFQVFASWMPASVNTVILMRIYGKERIMPKFQVGDLVQMPGVPFRREVLELGTCDEGDACEFGPEIFRFADPGTGEDDWMHSSHFYLVRRGTDV